MDLLRNHAKLKQIKLVFWLLGFRCFHLVSCLLYRSTLAASAPPGPKRAPRILGGCSAHSFEASWSTWSRDGAEGWGLHVVREEAEPPVRGCYYNINQNKLKNWKIMENHMIPHQIPTTSVEIRLPGLERRRARPPWCLGQGTTTVGAGSSWDTRCSEAGSVVGGTWWYGNFVGVTGLQEIKIDYTLIRKQREFLIHMDVNFTLFHDKPGENWKLKLGAKALWEQARRAMYRWCALLFTCGCLVFLTPASN